MWTSYPPRYHDQTWTPTAAQWCSAWAVPVNDGNAAVWIATYNGNTSSPSSAGWVPAGEGDTVTPPDGSEVAAIAYAPTNYRFGGQEGAVWHETSVPVSNLQPIGRVQCAYILSGCTVGAAVPPVTWPRSSWNNDVLWSQVRAWNRRAA